MGTTLDIFPLDPKIGVGFYAYAPINEFLTKGYRYEIKPGPHPKLQYHNYHVTKENWSWPDVSMNSWYSCEGIQKIDGFSPNLNKSLRAHHLRQLAFVSFLQQILKDAQFVALLGASQGIQEGALEEYKDWLDFVNYHPTIFKDTDFNPDNYKFDIRLIKKEDGSTVWENKLGREIIVIRADGRPLYSYYDLAFANAVAPTRYITGIEQAQHFRDLGLSTKHVQIGLVVDEKGMKLKSRSGDTMLAMEILETIMDMLGLEDKERAKKIAWNILAWNFLQTSRDHNIKFKPKEWIRSEAPGMYVTYTYARLKSALDGVSKETNLNRDELTQDDIELLGQAAQYKHYYNLATAHWDAASLCSYTYKLAKRLGSVYEREKIQGGRDAFIYTMKTGYYVLGECLKYLGMFQVEKV